MNEKKILWCIWCRFTDIRSTENWRACLLRRCVLIRVVCVKSKTLYEEDGEDMYEADLLYITTYMILSLHELISRCHLVHFCFYCHPVHSKFTILHLKNIMILYILLFILKYNCIVDFHFYLFLGFFSMFGGGGWGWWDIPYMHL